MVDTANPNTGSGSGNVPPHTYDIAMQTKGFITPYVSGGDNFKLWKEKTTAFQLVRYISEDKPVEDMVVESLWIRAKHGIVLTIYVAMLYFRVLTLDDSLYQIFFEKKTTKVLWESLQKKS